MNQSIQKAQLTEFIDELSGFAQIAEETLNLIEADLEGERARFEVFSERMISIRGTAQQLALPHIAHIAGLGEEIALKAKSSSNRPQLRKCVGSLWDALGTIKYLLEHPNEETSEEQKILVSRLEDTLRRLGGARQTLDEAEVELLLKSRN